MTGIGKQEFPEMNFSEALRIIDGIKREKAQTTAALGEVMKLKSTNTGYFYAKLSALSKFYGLLERDKTHITLSSLAKRIVYPLNDSDRASAIRESILRVGLTSELFRALGPEYHELDFSTKLLELTGASHEEISEKAERIQDLYRDALQYLRGQPMPSTSQKQESASSLQSDRGPSEVLAQPSQGTASIPPIQAGSAEDFYTFHTGDSFVRLKKKDPKLLHTTKRVIDAWLFAEGEEQPHDPSQ